MERKNSKLKKSILSFIVILFSELFLIFPLLAIAEKAKILSYETLNNHSSLLVLGVYIFPFLISIGLYFFRE